MTTKARKITPKTALKVAIFQSRRKQREIARAANIHEVRLSNIVTGRDEPKPEERRELSRVLHLPQRTLFPVEESAAAS